MTAAAAKPSLADLRDGFAAVDAAGAAFSSACAALVPVAATPEARDRLEACVRRLAAIRRHLARLGPQATQDAYFVALTRVEAGLLGLVESLREMRFGYEAVQTRPAPLRWAAELDGDDPNLAR